MSTATDICDKATTISELAATARDRSPASLSLTVLERKPGWRVVDLGELWRSRGVALLLDLARHQGPVQADGPGSNLGHPSAVGDDAGIQPVLGRVAGNPFKQDPLCVVRTFWARPVDVLLHRHRLGRSEHGGEPEPGHQDLLPSVDHPDGSRRGLPRPPCDLLRHASIHDGLVWSDAELVVRPVPAADTDLLITALGVGTLLSALTVSYRDFRHIVPFLVQFWMFATPSVYLQRGKAALDPGKRLLLLLNPAHGLIANLRATLMGLPLDYLSLAISTIAGLGLLFAGCVCFRQMEGTFADII